MQKLDILVGKTVQKVSRFRGNGSALPGLVVERMDSKFITKVLGDLPYGVVVVSGTNGKTTTTKIISELLESQGLRVFTNPTGSNFVRGVISSIIKNIKITGKFNYDIAVLELDEAHAVKFCEVVDVNYALFLNVQRDQLDRFGEIDYTASLLQKIADVAKDTVVLNREDPRVSKISANKTAFFGLSDELVKSFPSDDDLLGKSDTKASKKKASVVLKKLDDKKATYLIDGKEYETNLKLKGVYNAYNAAGALAMVRAIKPEAKVEELIEKLATIESAFGRGEVFDYKGCEIELLLVKNPSAFQLSLNSFADKKYDYMIAINDQFADGRDVSWLWNVDFSSLPKVSVCSGVRATDMALRLKYDGIKADKVVEDLREALDVFLGPSKRPKRIFATYTAMLEIRKIISGKSLV